jgi:hypothetical protein
MKHAIRTVYYAVALALTASPGWQSEAKAQTWPNEPPGLTVITDNPFTALSGSGWNTGYNTGQCNIIADGTAPLSPSSALQMVRPVGQTGGCKTYYATSFGTSVYMAAKWKPSNPFWGWANLSNKLFMMFSTSADGQPASTWFEMFGGQQGGPYWPGINLEYPGVNNCHLYQGGGSCTGPGPVVLHGNVVATLGQWHTLEVYLQKGTSETSRNGIVRWWVDGILAGNYTTANHPAGAFNEFNIGPSWDSGDPTQRTVDSHEWDHVRISSTGGSGVTLDTKPPAIPAGLRIN